MNTILIVNIILWTWYPVGLLGAGFIFIYSDYKDKYYITLEDILSMFVLSLAGYFWILFILVGCFIVALGKTKDIIIWERK